MFVHQDRPLLGGEWTEEGVGMGGAGCGACSGEAVDELAEVGPFDGKVAVIVDDEGLCGGGVAAHGLVVAQDQGLDDGAEDAADEGAGRADGAECHVETGGAVGEGLRGSHGAPLAGAVGGEVRYARLDLAGGRGVEEAFHECECTAAVRLRGEDLEGSVGWRDGSVECG